MATMEAVKSSSHKSSHHSSSGITSSYSSHSATHHSSSGGALYGSDGYVTSSHEISKSVINGTSYVEPEYYKHTYLVTSGKISREDEKLLFGQLNERLRNYIETIKSMNLKQEQFEFFSSSIKQYEQIIIDQLEHHYHDLFLRRNAELEEWRKKNAILNAEVMRVREEAEAQHLLVVGLDQSINMIKGERSKAALTIQDLRKTLAVKQETISKLEITKRELSTSSFQHVIDQLIVDIEVVVKESAQWESQYEAMKKELELAVQIYNKLVAEYRRDIRVDTYVEKIIHDIDAYIIEEVKALKYDFDKRLSENNFEFGHFSIDFSTVQHYAKRLISERDSESGLLAGYHADIRRLEGIIAQHRAEVAKLKATIDGLEHFSYSGEDLEVSLSQSLIHVEEEVNAMRREYRRFMDLKLLLDSEINAYNALVAGEEHRLGIKYVKQRIDEHTGRKVVTESESEEPVIFDEINMDGDYIHLTNKEKAKTFNFNGWTIIVRAGGRTEQYTFHQDIVLQPGQDISLWSHNRGGHNNPPESLIMNFQWPSGDTVDMELKSPHGHTRASVTAYYKEQKHQTITNY